MSYQEPIKKQWADVWRKEYILKMCEKEISEINKKIEDAAKKGVRKIEYKCYVSTAPIYSLINLYIENGFKVDYIEEIDKGIESRRYGKEYLRIIFQW